MEGLQSPWGGGVEFDWGSSFECDTVGLVKGGGDSFGVDWHLDICQGSCSQAHGEWCILSKACGLCSCRVEK